MPKPIHLIINQASFLNATRTLLVDRGSFAIGRVRRRATQQAEEFIIDQWKVVNELPTGADRPPMLDWAVVTTNFDGNLPPNKLVQRVAPKSSQCLVAISLDAKDHSKFPATIHFDKRSFTPEQIRFIGSGLLTLPQRPLQDANQSGDLALPRSSDMHSDWQLNPLTASQQLVRASRTRGALDTMYDRLSGLSIVLIGAGGGGQELARQLVGVGVRRLILIDGDIIGPENLDRMPSVSPHDVGKPKVIKLGDALFNNQPDAVISCLAKSVTDPEAVRLLRETRVDTVFTFVDNNEARLAASRLCQETETVHVDIGSMIERHEKDRIMSADIRLFEPRSGCVACVPKMDHLEDVLYELAKPPGCLRRGRSSTWDEERAGSLLHLNAFAVSLAVETWLGWLQGSVTTSHWGRVRWNAGKSPQISSAAVTAGAGCCFCNLELN